MSSNGPPRNYFEALKMNLKTCAKGTKLRVYIKVVVYKTNRHDATMSKYRYIPKKTYINIDINTSKNPNLQTKVKQ